MKLSLLSILLGAGMSVPQIYGLARPQALAAGVRKFPRNYAAGLVLMLLATGWFVWIVNNEPIADFSKIPAGDREAEVHRAIERYAVLLDRYCRSDPFNWFNFFDFWRGQSDPSDA